MSNLPILYQNIMSGLKSDAGRDAFLWATERPENDRMCYVAERFAHEVELLDASNWDMLKICSAIQESSPEIQNKITLGGKIDLNAFILRRHAHWRFPAAKEVWV